jgi:hypothetical protein
MAYPPGSYLYWNVFLAVENLAVGSHTIGPVPAGTVWIVREANMYNNAITPSTVNVTKSSNATFAYAGFPGDAAPETVNFVQWTGHVPIFSGGSFFVVVGGNGSDVTITGIVLPATLIT